MKIRRADLPAFARAFIESQAYRGRSLFVEVVPHLDIPTDAGLWGGGTCEKYYALFLNGPAVAASTNNGAPWSECGRGERIDIPANACIARRFWFQGRDCGITFYVAAPLKSSPASVDESSCRGTVLGLESPR